MLVIACNKPWDNDSILWFIGDSSHCTQPFIESIFVSNFKQFKLFAGSILCGKTVSFAKVSCDGVWRCGMVFIRLVFIVHSVSMVSAVSNSPTTEELLTR